MVQWRECGRSGLINFVVPGDALLAVTRRDFWLVRWDVRQFHGAGCPGHHRRVRMASVRVLAG